jgi:hypothetical protein
MIDLAIITPCSRPKNIEQVMDSVIAATVPGVRLRWLVVMDAEIAIVPACLVRAPFEVQISLVPSVQGGKRISVSGNLQRNWALGQIDQGCVFFLDDDTTMHPDLLREAIPILARNPGVNLGYHLWIRGHLASFPAFLETGQIIHDRECIGENRWLPLMQYDADRVFNLAQYGRWTSKFVILDKVLHRYNTLRLA